LHSPRSRRPAALIPWLVCQALPEFQHALRSCLSRSQSSSWLAAVQSHMLSCRPGTWCSSLQKIVSRQSYAQSLTLSFVLWDHLAALGDLRNVRITWRLFLTSHRSSGQPSHLTKRYFLLRILGQASARLRLLVMHPFAYP
jgi:hypothetical protein